VDLLQTVDLNHGADLALGSVDGCLNGWMDGCAVSH
jgi:hypothetical protein